MQSRQPIPCARRTIRWCLCLVPLLGTMLALPAAAQQARGIGIAPGEPAAPRYAVELILFAYGDGVATGNEVFPPDDIVEEEPAADGLVFGDRHDERAFGGEPQPGDAVTGAEPGGLARPDPASGLAPLEPMAVPADIEVAVLPREQLTLTDAFDTLSRLDAYRPVVWTGWTQTVHESDVTPAIRLRRLARIPLEFDGTLKLYLSRFLHLEIDLTMEDRQVSTPRSGGSGREPVYGDAAWPDPVVRRAETVRYRIREDRIVKNGDLRYFDHPRFGLLAKISRVTDDAAAGDTGTPVLPPPEPADP